MKREEKQSGFTMIEVAIVSVIMGVMILAVVVFAGGTGKAYESMSADTELNFNLRRAMERMGEELRRSQSGRVTITTLPGASDRVEFDEPVQLKDGAVVWGAEGHEGWTVRFLVEEDTLIRRIVDGTGTIEAMDQVLATSVDGVWTGKMGFSASANGNLITLTLRLSTRERTREWRRELSTAVSLRN